MRRRSGTHSSGRHRGGRHRSGLARDRRAVTALEFALLATPMLWLVLGTVEFGRWMWMKQALQATAAEAARCMAVLNPSCASGSAYSSSNTTRYVQGLASAWGVSLTTAQITLNRAASSGSVTGLSEVQLSYSFQSVVSTFVPGLSGTMALTGHAYVSNWQ